MSTNKAKRLTDRSLHCIILTHRSILGLKSRPKDVGKSKLDALADIKVEYVSYKKRGGMDEYRTDYE